MPERTRAAIRAADLPATLKTRAVIDDVLAVERDAATGVVTQATVRNTWVKEGSPDNTPIPRIDTWVRTPEGWKMRRTLSLFERPKET